MPERKSALAGRAAVKKCMCVTRAVPPVPNLFLLLKYSLLLVVSKD